MRATNIGLRAGDIDDSPQAWAEARRAADFAPVAIVGDSRILFDTDQARFQALTGVRPVQVAMSAPTPARCSSISPTIPKFHGLLIVGMADTMYFGMPVIGLGGTAIHNYAKNDKPSQLTGLWIDRWLQQYLAFMDRRLPAERHAAEARPRLAQGRRQPVRRRLEDLRGLPRPAILHVGPDREATPICAATRATPGTASRARTSRRRWPTR